MLLSDGDLGFTFSISFPDMGKVGMPHLGEMMPSPFRCGRFQWRPWDLGVLRGSLTNVTSQLKPSIFNQSIKLSDPFCLSAKYGQRMAHFVPLCISQVMLCVQLITCICPTTPKWFGVIHKKSLSLPSGSLHMWWTMTTANRSTIYWLVL